MIVVGIYIKDSVTLQYNRVELFSDEKISVNSSIQNVNDISKTYTDFSQTFTVPASKQNNKIFRHWYENSNDNGFSTLVKADAYIEIDTIPFRSGKIQLESANVKDGQPQDYSITFIGALGSLKDKFNGLYLKDLTDTTYDFNYSAANVRDKVVDSDPSTDVMFPLISSNRYWNYGKGGNDDISTIANPIRFNELFPALRLRAVLNMIENQFGINFDGTVDEPSTFLSDVRFTNAYLYLKNAETFEYIPSYELYTFSNNYTNPTPTNRGWSSANSSTGRFTSFQFTAYVYKKVVINLYPTVAGINYKVELLNVTTNSIVSSTSVIVSTTVLQSFTLLNIFSSAYYNNEFEVRITAESSITFSSSSFIRLSGGTAENANIVDLTKTISQTINVSKLSIKNYMPEIKIEDFFSGLLKMFNLTCYSTDGINYTVEQLESYYTSGQIRDITKYIKSDNVNLNRVKTYKKINFEYEKSESLVNVGFMSANGIEYGSLFYNTNNDGDEYNIKLPFENLNFNNLQDKLQVGYCLKTDYQAYIPKPVILYDYFPQGTVYNTNPFYFSTLTSGNGVAYNDYKAFGQEYREVDFPTILDTYSLNFNQQQSTLTNEVITNSLYQQYYENYLANIFDSKARLIKVSGILPTSLLTTLKLNDRLIIRDNRYLINTFTTDLTTGEVQFELLTDFRELEPIKEIVIGTQTWTNSNLNVETYRDGTSIPQVTDPTAWAGLTTGAWCYYNNDSANEAIYGKLYNWYAVSNTVNGGLAPTGYHIPTDTEWTTLTTYLGGESVAGGKMKLTGTSIWNTPNTGATNSSDFTGFPAGNRRNDALFNNIGNYGYFWSFSESTSTTAWSRYLDYSDDNVFRNSYNKKYGFSVRLIKD